MKRNTPNHPKTALLMQELNCTLPMAVGILELLWHFAAQFCPRGNIGIYPNNLIAQRVGWIDDCETLISALISSRWIDEHFEHRLLIHDWHEHSDDAVHLALARKTEIFANGEIPRFCRLSKIERKRIEKAYAQKAHNMRTECAQEAHEKRTALPSPPMPSLAMPIPVLDPPIVPQGGPREDSQPSHLDSQPSQDNPPQFNHTPDAVAKTTTETANSGAQGTFDGLGDIGQPKTAKTPPRVKLPSKSYRRGSGQLNQAQQAYFDAFWAAYPAKLSIGQAEVTFGKIWDLLPPLDELLETIPKYTADCLAKNRNFQNPSTWLNAKGWQNNYEEPKKQHNGWNLTEDTTAEF